MKARVLTHAELDAMRDPPEHETKKEFGDSFAAGWYKSQVEMLKESNRAALAIIAAQEVARLRSIYTSEGMRDAAAVLIQQASIGEKK